MSKYEEIIYEVIGSAALITLNRPEKLNAWTTLMGREVKTAVGVAERDKTVVGIVITGAGRGFCSGADLGLLSGIGDSSHADRSGGTKSGAEPDQEVGDPTWGEDFAGEYTYLMRVPKPIIAAINGPILGVAVSFALACDLRFMATDAVLTTSFSHRALIAEYGISWLLPRLVGSAIALDLLWSSRKLDGSQAEQLGLVNRAVSKEDIVTEALSYISDLANYASPTSVAVMKRQVYQQLHQGLGRAELESKELMRESFRKPDFVEVVRSLRDKRPPRFNPL